MDRNDKDIVEHSIYKLKGIAGILDVLASEEPVGIRDETQNIYGVLCDDIRAVCEELKKVV